jgi:phosphoglycolate phosphatase-like HAD superfamily hydrolase
MIGDAVTDVAAGRAAGLRTCAVTWGVHSIAQLRAAEPDAVADSVEALHALLLG